MPSAGGVGPVIPPGLQSLRVAIVHDYLNQAGGAEKVAEVLAEMFPEAPIYTSIYDRSRMPVSWTQRDVRTTFMQRIAPRLAVARALFPLYPVAFESMDLRDFDVVISSTTAYAKGVITRPETFHICYCNNPTRFLWMTHEYLEHAGLPRLVGVAVSANLSPLRVWDYAAAQRVDHFVAGSRNASRRIAKYYRRDSDVIHSPIDFAAFNVSDVIDDYFLILARLQPYKRIDLAIQACNSLRLPLVIIGEGSDRKRLESIAGPTVRFLGRVADDEVRRRLSRCRALLWPGEEDFGLAPLEAQASGRPVVAYRAGGALETVIEGETGVFFPEQTVEALTEALKHFEDRFDRERLRQNAEKFDRRHFVAKMYSAVESGYQTHRDRMGL